MKTVFPVQFARPFHGYATASLLAVRRQQRERNG
jgi:hypothetical protein